MIRKVSSKPIVNQDKHRKLELRTSDNEYYLPHPQVRIIKTPNKDSSFDHQKDKNYIKNPKKNAQNGPQRTYSTANFKTQMPNVSKEHDQPNPAKPLLSKKVETRKIRCTSNVETPRKISSKSGFKVQLNSLKKEGGGKRLNLKIETPTTKKSQKLNLNSMNFDNYYNNDHPHLSSKTTRGIKRPESTQSHISNSYQYSVVFSRCKNLMEEYREELESVKRENRMLHDENQRLKQYASSLKKA